MAALLRKDVYLIGKNIWILIVSALFVSFVPRLENFGSVYLSVLTMTLPLTTMAYDEHCHWDAYLAMTPCRPETVVLSKYLFTAGLAAAAMGLSFLICCAQAAAAGAAYDMTGTLMARVSPLVMVLTVNAVPMPTVFRFGVEKGRLTMIALMGCIFAILVGGAQIIGMERMFRWMDRVPLTALVIAAAAVVIVMNAASFFLSVRFYRKRQNGVYN